MNNLLCHTGRIFTTDELEGKAKAERESMTRKLEAALEDDVMDDVVDDDARL
jgi:hypothetical protein